MEQNDAPPMSLGGLLADTARLMRRRFDAKARALGLTRAQWQMLATLSRNEGINQAGLADLLDVEPITLCRLVDRMEEGGWVERRLDPADRRARLLYMADKARPVITQMRILANELGEEATDGVSAEDRERFLATLIQMRGNISRALGRATDDPLGDSESAETAVRSTP